MALESGNRMHMQIRTAITFDLDIRLMYHGAQKLIWNAHEIQMTITLETGVQLMFMIY